MCLFFHFRLYPATNCSVSLKFWRSPLTPALPDVFFCIFALRLLDLSPSHHVHHEQFFLLRDERLKIDGPVTKVPFPKGCRKLRVYSYAWFEKEKEWRVIRDKVCTWGRRKKTYTLMVTNQMVESFQLLSAGGLE